MIQSQGPSSPKFFLIADGGSPHDEETNYAITGSVENILRQIMGSQISFNDAWRTCLIKERINATDFDSYKDKLDIYKNILLDEIKELNPFLLIPLGELSFRLLTGNENIRKFRGSVINTSCLPNPIKVLPILGPNPYIYQDQTNKWISQIDFSKVHRFLNNDPPPEQTLNIWIAKNYNSLRNFLDRSYNPDGLLVFDIETFLGIPTCISFCFDGRESVCIPFIEKSIPLEERMRMGHLVARILNSPIKKVNQNIKYDIKCLEKFNLHVTNVYGDTMLNAGILTPEFPKNLGFLNSIYNDIPYFKDEGKEYDPYKGKETLYLYNAKDSLATYRIFTQQRDEIDQVKCTYVADKLNQLIIPYKRMEDQGLWYDDEVRVFLVAKYESLFEMEKLKIKTIYGEEINPMSPKQCARLIFEDLGYKKSQRVKGTGEEDLEHLMVFGVPTKSPALGRTLLQTIINCRKLHKVIEYLHTVPYPDGKYRCDYSLIGTETGRTTAGKTTDQLITWKELKTMKRPEFLSMGRSFQTIGKHGFMIDGETYGKDLRKVYVPSRGYSFVEIDLSQAEARVDAVLSGNFDILSVFDGPVGIHKLTGSWVFQCPPEEIKKNTVVNDPRTGIAVDRYLMSKTVRHAGERNMGANRLVMMSQQPKRFCEDVLKTFHDKQPEIREVFHREIRECIKNDRTLVAPNGRRRQFLSNIDEHTINEAISQLPQCIVGDQVKFSFIDIFKDDFWAYLCVEQHDGFMAEVPTGREMEYYEICKPFVEREIDFKTCSLSREFKLVIPSEVSKSEENWYSLKEIKI